MTRTVFHHDQRLNQVAHHLINWEIGQGHRMETGAAVARMVSAAAILGYPYRVVHGYEVVGGNGGSIWRDYLWYVIDGTTVDLGLSMAREMYSQMVPDHPYPRLRITEDTRIEQEIRVYHQVGDPMAAMMARRNRQLLQVCVENPAYYLHLLQRSDEDCDRLRRELTSLLGRAFTVVDTGSRS